MKKLDNIIKRLEDIRDDMPSVIKAAFESGEDLIVSLVRDDQLFDRGVNGFDVKINSYEPYAESTLRRKRRVGQPTDRVTLKDSGSFYEGFLVEYFAEGFRVTSTDSKAEHLADRYGGSIFVPTSENRAIMVSTLVRPEIVKKLRNG